LDKVICITYFLLSDPLRIVGGPHLLEQKWNKLVKNLLIAKSDVVGVWNFSKVHFSLVVESLETDGILFVNFSVFHKGNFGVSNVVCSEPFGLLWVNDCVVLEFDELETIESAESFFVLS